jgi:hypothetical protein
LTKPTKLLTETERLLKYLEENLKDKKVDVKHKINDKDELECLFVQTDYMEEWYNKYGYLMNIDGTYCVMVENFLLFHTVCQNENLNGVPVAYCFMKNETKENLEFFYENLNRKNDRYQKIVMVDKDLSNIQLILHFYNAIILLCTFHVVKYFKKKLEKMKCKFQMIRNLNYMMSSINACTRKD